VLAVLLDNARLQRMIEGEGMAGLGRRGATCTRSARCSATCAAASGARRTPGGPSTRTGRRLQRTYVETIAAKVSAPTGPTLPVVLPGLTIAPAPNAADARALLRGELADLDRDLAGAVRRAGDRTSRLHLLDARREIARILDPKRD
jgi:hypothetical protein